MKKLFVVNMLVLLGYGGAWAQPLKLPMYNAHPQTANFSFHQSAFSELASRLCSGRMCIFFLY